MTRIYILLVALMLAACHPKVEPVKVADALPPIKSCLFAGDSITSLPDGLGAQFIPTCKTDAKVGIPSGAIIARVAPGFDLVVISAGSNDPDNPSLLANLRAMRKKASGEVIWIEPRDVRAAIAVAIAARDNHDAVLPFQAGHDGVHPQNYHTVANNLKLLESRLK